MGTRLSGRTLTHVRAFHDRIREPKMDSEFFDCHTHTEFSSCAEDVTLQGYIEIAESTSQQFAITDHSAQIFYPPEQRWGFWSEDAVPLFEANQESGRERIITYVQTIREAQCGGMFVGIELDVLPDGRKVFPDGWLERLDLIAGAVHYMPTLQPDRPDIDEVYDEFRFQVEALAGHGMDVLVHPYRLILAADLPVSDELLDWTVRFASEADFAVEINSHKQFPDCDLRMARLALEVGATIAIGTDTHNTAEFGDFDYHTQILREAGLSADCWGEHLLQPPVAAQEAAAK
jgi:histidinol phosphatase-like PHP family hydrolase